MRRYDRIIGLIWFVIGSGMAIEGINLGPGSLQSPGVGFMALLVGISLGLCGLVLTVLVTMKGKEDDGKIWEGQNWKNRGLPVFYLFIYAFLMERLGFLITTFLFLFFMIKLTAPKRWLSPVLTSLVIASCSYVIFSLWLKVLLPKGSWGIG